MTTDQQPLTKRRLTRAAFLFREKFDPSQLISQFAKLSHVCVRAISILSGDEIQGEHIADGERSETARCLHAAKLDRYWLDRIWTGKYIQKFA